MMHLLTFHRHFSESFAEQRRIFLGGGPETSTPSAPEETDSPEINAPDEVEAADLPDDAREDSAENQDEATQEEVDLATRQFEIFLRQEQLVGLLRERMMANRRDRYHTNREALTLSRMRNRFQPAQQAKIQELFQRVQMLSAYDTTLTRQYEEQVRRMNRMNPHHSSYDEAVFREPVPALDGLPPSFPRGGPSGAPSGVPQESSAAPQSETLSYDQLEPDRKKIVDGLLQELNGLPSDARKSPDGKPTAAASRILGALLMQGVDAESSLTKPQIGNEDITIYRMGTLPFILSVIKGISYQFQSFFGKLENSGEDGEDDMDRKTRDELKDAIDAKKEEIEKLEEEPDDEKPDDKSKREQSLKSAKEELVKLEEALARNLWKNAAILSLKQSTKKKFSDTTLTDDSFKNSAKEILQFFQTVLREKTDAAPTNISLEDALTTEKRTQITEQLVQLAEQVAPALCPVRKQDGSFEFDPRFRSSLPNIYAGSLRTSFDNIDDFIQHIEQFEEKNTPSTSPTSEPRTNADAPVPRPGFSPTEIMTPKSLAETLNKVPLMAASDRSDPNTKNATDILIYLCELSIVKKLSPLLMPGSKANEAYLVPGNQTCVLYNKNKKKWEEMPLPDVAAGYLALMMYDHATTQRFQKFVDEFGADTVVPALQKLVENITKDSTMYGVSCCIKRAVQKGNAYEFDIEKNGNKSTLSIQLKNGTWEVEAKAEKDAPPRDQINEQEDNYSVPKSKEEGTRSLFINGLVDREFTVEWLGENSADGFGSFYKISKGGKIAYLDLSNNFAHDLISQCRLFQDEARNGPYISLGGERDSDDQATGRIAAALGVDIPFQGASLKNSDERELNQAQKNALQEFRSIHRDLHRITHDLRFGDERWILDPPPNQARPDAEKVTSKTTEFSALLKKVQAFIIKYQIQNLKDDPFIAHSIAELPCAQTNVSKLLEIQTRLSNTIKNLGK